MVSFTLLNAPDNNPMKRTFSFLLLLLLGAVTVHSQNLLPNPSLELVSDSYCGIMSPGQFTATVDEWTSPTPAAPQVFFTSIDETCYNHQPISLYDGPIGIKGSQEPRTGSVMGGLWVYTIAELNQRQYIQSALDSPMEAGLSYVVEFYVSLADSMEFATDRLGAHLSTNAVFAVDDGPLDVTPQVESSEFINDASGWTVVRDTIVATEDYNFITIGSFHDDASTNLEANPLHSGAVSTYGAYYFIDDVRIAEVEPVGMAEYTGFQPFIFPTHVQNIFRVHLPASMSNARLEVFDAQGTRCMNEVQESSVRSLDISGLAPAVYLVRLVDGASVISQRIVKR